MKTGEYYNKVASAMVANSLRIHFFCSNRYSEEPADFRCSITVAADRIKYEKMKERII